jgi:hypothetical protein
MLTLAISEKNQGANWWPLGCPLTFLVRSDELTSKITSLLIQKLVNLLELERRMVQMYHNVHPFVSLEWICIVSLNIHPLLWIYILQGKRFPSGDRSGGRLVIPSPRSLASRAPRWPSLDRPSALRLRHRLPSSPVGLPPTTGLPSYHRDAPSIASYHHPMEQ